MNIKLSHDAKIELIKRCIKHPHFQYAEFNVEKNIFKIKWKKPWEWFSGKRIVVCIVKPLKLNVSGFADYKRFQ